MMHDHRQSDRSVVSTNRPNTAGLPAAEGGETRERPKGNSLERIASRTQSRTHDASNALERVREAARRDRHQRFTALLQHVYDPAQLSAAFFALTRAAAAGVDGETWQHYEQDLASHLADLSGRLQRGAYRAQPVRRAYIPKADGRLRPLGVPTLEDKLVQRAVVEVLNAVYEGDFLGFSYGFRPGRSQHAALDALSAALLTTKVNWVLDTDIRAFFDTVNHEWLIRFIEHRIADQRLVRLIQKWLNAGVLEEGERRQSDVGTVQGGSISPLLANIYLHYVFDLWAHRWRRREARGTVMLVRYADDVVVGFEHRAEAERFLADLRERFARFGLALHPDKTRLLEFGRYAADRRRRRGDGKPETFNFLGFTHICGTTRDGTFTVQRQTMRQRMVAKLQAVKAELRRRLHQPLPEVGSYLAAVVRGHGQYYAVPLNHRAVSTFRRAVGRLWHRQLARRSQTGRVAWRRMRRLIARWLPSTHVCHPHPLERFRRHHPRGEPDAGMPHVRFCGGGAR
jgi:group II intron reverse transcriptase/maturase